MIYWVVSWQRGIYMTKIRQSNYIILQKVPTVARSLCWLSQSPTQHLMPLWAMVMGTSIHPCLAPWPTLCCTHYKPWQRSYVWCGGPCKSEQIIFAINRSVSGFGTSTHFTLFTCLYLQADFSSVSPLASPLCAFMIKMEAILLNGHWFRKHFRHSTHSLWSPSFQ